MRIINNDNIFYENIDFLTLRMSRFDNPLFITCIGLVDNSPDIILDFGFRLVFRDVIRNGKLKIIEIRDSENNDCGQIRVKLIPDPKDYINHDELEFTSFFFTAYYEHFDYFLEIFNFDKNKQSTISRIDYCIDFLDISVQDFRDLRKTVSKKEAPFLVGDVYTYFRYENQRHKLVFYNKRLDTIDKNKHRTKAMNGVYPYKKYVSDLLGQKYITRVEYRKNSQSFRDLQNNSLSWVLINIRSMMIQYLYTFIDINITCDSIPYNQNIPVKRDVIYQKEIDRKARISLSRAEAYMSSYIDLEGETKLFNALYAKFGYRLFSFMKNMPIDTDFADKIFYDHLKEN